MELLIAAVLCYGIRSKRPDRGIWAMQLACGPRVVTLACAWDSEHWLTSPMGHELEHLDGFAFHPQTRQL